MSFSALTAGLEETLGSSAKVTLQAIGAQEAALTAIAAHTDKLREAMDSEVSSELSTFECRLLISYISYLR